MQLALHFDEELFTSETGAGDDSIWQSSGTGQPCGGPIFVTVVIPLRKKPILVNNPRRIAGMVK
jgi:hypothetical protein